MKAVVCAKYGPAEGLELKDVEKPIPKDNEILIKIFATTVTSGDTVLRGLSFLQYLLMWPIARLFFGIKNLRKKILGHEFAGEVEAAGKDVQNFKAGDWIFGTTGFEGGAHAEYVCLPDDAVVTIKPTDLNYEQAAAVPIGSICALNFLRQGNIQHDQKILIYGASGSIGTYAVQLAKYFGAQVTAVCSTANVDLVKSLGADKVLDYTKPEFPNNVEMYDFIFDTVGKCPASLKQKALNKKGHFVSTQSSPVKETVDDLLFIKELIENGKLKPVIDRTYPLVQIVEAHKYVEQFHKKGNVVVTVQNETKA